MKSEESQLLHPYHANLNFLFFLFFEQYKRHLIHDDLDRINKLTTQLSYRLSEGSGFAQYRIGVVRTQLVVFLFHI